MPANIKPIAIGTQFGRWTVVAPTAMRSSAGNVMYLCDCACGSVKRKAISRHHLVRGRSRSCGCLRREMNAVAMTAKRAAATAAKPKRPAQAPQRKVAALSDVQRRLPVEPRSGVRVLATNADGKPTRVALAPTDSTKGKGSDKSTRELAAQAWMAWLVRPAALPLAPPGRPRPTYPDSARAPEMVA